MTYIPADMVTTNYGLPPKAWKNLQDAYQKHLESHPTCEICRDNKSVRITPLGPIKAACLECINQQRQEMIDEYEREMEYDYDQHRGYYEAR